MGARPVVIGLALAVLALLPAGCAVADRTTQVAPVAVPVAPPSVAPMDRPVRPSREGEPGLWMSWSLLETETGRRAGSANAATERTNAESSIKAWIAADLLRTAADDGRAITGAERELIRRAVRSSDDSAAETLYRRSGGGAVLEDLRTTCGVDVATNRRGYWSYAQVTAVDATRTLECVLRLAPRWPGGADLIGDLRAVDDDGLSGIATQLPGTPVAEKNGWTYHSDSGWNVNCVVAWDGYVLAVMTRFSGARPEEYGWGVCRDVARDVLPLSRF